jgi:DNA-binding MarR family transcriptional regulator
MQRATRAVDDAAAARLGLIRTDLRCLEAILVRGPVAASKLYDVVGLTRRSMTPALDRLEEAGFIRRIIDLTDRRRINVEAKAAAKQAASEIWEPLGEDGLRLLERYSDEELEILVRFFQEYSALQRAHARRIGELGAR